MKKRHYIDMSTSWKNSIKFSKAKKKPRPDGTYIQSETPEHRKIKFIICNFFVGKAIDYHTEAVFKNNNRADVICESWNLALEIMHTEKYKDLLKKEYPCNVLAIPTTISEQTIITMLEDLMSTNGKEYQYYNELFNGKP